MKPAWSVEIHGLLCSGDTLVEKSQRQQGKGWEAKSHGNPVTAVFSSVLEYSELHLSRSQSSFGVFLGLTVVSIAFQSPRPLAGPGAVDLCHRCSVLIVDCHAILACIVPELIHVSVISWIFLKSIVPSQQSTGMNKAVSSDSMLCLGRMMLCSKFFKGSVTQTQEVIEVCS